MKTFTSILSVSLIAIFLTSCFNKNNWNNNNTPLANNDVYMRGIKTMPANNTFTDASMRISRVEPAGDSIRLYTHIIDGDGMFTTGAAHGNFRTNWCDLTVNGEQVSGYTVREVTESQRVPTVYALVLDHSGSMGNKAQKMQDAVRQFINKKNPQDAICIVKYDSHTNLEVPINTNASVLQAQFQSNGLQGYGGTTAIINGLMKGMETIQPAMYRRKVVISFTDGADNSSTITKEYATWYAQQNNINLCTIDFNNSNYNNFMQELANNTGGTYTYFTNTNQFGDVFDDVVNKMNHSYVVTYKRKSAGYQTVLLKYCGEPQALEAHADFSPDRSSLEPIRNTTPPASNANTASSADQPVYYRPASYYTNNNGPYKGGSGTNIKGSTTPPRTPNGNNGIDAGDLKGQPGTGRPNPNGNNGNVTKPQTSPANGSGVVRPGSSSNPGSNSKPETSPANGSGVVKPGGSGSTPNSNTKPGTSPVNSSGSMGQGSGTGSGVTKPGTSPSGITKPGTSPVNSSGSMGQGSGTGSGVTKPSTSPSGMKDKPVTTNPANVTKPVTTKPNTSTPSSSGSGTITKPAGKNPSTTPSSGTTNKPGSGASGTKDAGGIRPSRGPQ